MKIRQTKLKYDTKKLQAINPMVLLVSWENTYLHNCKLEELKEPPLRQSMYLWQQVQ